MTEYYLYNDGIGKVALVDHMGTDLTVVNSARVSYGGNKTKLDEKDKKLIRYLIKNKHVSTLEHCHITFKMVVPLFVRSQHHRHRTNSFNERSFRYSGDFLEFYYPPEWRTQSVDNKQCSGDSFSCPEIDAAFKEHVNNSIKLYHEMIDKGVARELARMVLPQNLYTEYYTSTNLRNALHFIDLRLHPHAQWEIQRVAWAMKEILLALFPETIAAYNEILN